MSEKNLKGVVGGAFKADKSSAAAMGEEKLGKYSKTATKMFHTGVVSAKEMVLPSIGQFFERMVTGVEVYRMLFFISVLKIDVLYVTLILAIVGIYDVLNNPIMGIVYDRTRTRFGKSKPWLLFGMIPYYAATAALYSGALWLGNLPGNAPKKIIFVFTMLMLQETFSTMYKIPRENLWILQSVNPGDRIKVGITLQYVGELGAQLIYVAFIPLTEIANKGILPISLPQVYATIGCAAAGLACVGNMTLFFGVKERVLLQPKPQNPIKQLLAGFKNKYNVRIWITQFLTSPLSTVSAISSDGYTIYTGYSWDVVAQQEIMGGAIPTLIAWMPNNIADILSVALIPKIKKVFKNNRDAFIFFRIWDTAFEIMIVVFGCMIIGNSTDSLSDSKRWLFIAVFGILFGLKALNNGPTTVVEKEVMREITDYTEYVTGDRPDGSSSIVIQLINKITAPLNAMLTVFLFKWSGYDPTITMLPWSQGSGQVYKRVLILWMGLGVIYNIIKTVPYFFYDLVGKNREQMYIELNSRRAALANENAMTDELVILEEVLQEGQDTAATSNV